MATDALSMRIFAREREHKPIPKPSDPLVVKKTLDENQIVRLIRVNLGSWHQKSKSKRYHQEFAHPVKKGTITVPLDRESLTAKISAAIFEKAGIKPE